MGWERVRVLWIGVKWGVWSEGGKGFGEVSRRKTVKEWKGGGAVEGKRVVAREASVVEKRWVRRSKTAIWWISLWMKGTSVMVARRMRAKSGWVEGRGMIGVGVGDG